MEIIYVGRTLLDLCDLCKSAVAWFAVIYAYPVIIHFGVHHKKFKQDGTARMICNPFYQLHSLRRKISEINLS